MPAIRSFVLAVLCLVATFAHALTAQVSETFPLADTIYGPSAGKGKLRSDGRHAFLFWLDEDRVNVTRIDGEERVAKLVLPFRVFAEYDFDAVWTGSHFLVVATSPGYTLFGQRVDSSGDSVGEPFPLVDNALWPRLAFNGRNVLLLYNRSGVMTQLLTREGTPVGERRELEPALLSTSELHLVSNGDGFAAIVPAGAYTPEALYVLDAQGERVARQPLDTTRAEWTLVSNGSRYFAVSTNFGQSAAHLFEGNGTPAGRVELQPTAGNQRFYRFPAATWTGTRWLLALYIDNGTLTRLMEIDAEGRISAQSDLPGASRMQLTTAGNRVVGAWQQQSIGMVAAELPLVGSPRRVLFAARHQTFLATATSSSGTLFVWRDLESGRGALRAGLRKHDGRWSEREIATGFRYALAASDGQGFVVITRSTLSGVERIIRLDANGEPIPGGTEPFETFEPLAIESNGTGYALVGVRLNDSGASSNLLTVQITSGGVSPVHEIPFLGRGVVDIDIASDGEEYLVAWGVQAPCSPALVFCGAERIAGMFLTGSAVPKESLVVLTEKEPTSELALEWNGRDYVLVRDAGGVVASHISRTGAPRDRHVVTTKRGSSISAVPANGGVVVSWIADGVGVLAATVTDRGADGQPLTIDDDPRNFPWYGGTLAAIGNGELAFVFSAQPAEAPIHGRLHVMAKIISPALPPLPAAPLLTVQRDGANATLQWTASGPVDGYRVEQRIGDGAWTEVGGWLDAGVRTLTVRAGASTQFRVRAFNEAGAGAYSRGVGRRRAVR